MILHIFFKTWGSAIATSWAARVVSVYREGRQCEIPVHVHLKAKLSRSLAKLQTSPNSTVNTPGNERMNRWITIVTRYC